MKFHRIRALMLRYLLVITRSSIRVVDICYWPTIDIITFGMLGTWIQTTQTDVPNISFVLLACQVLWSIAYHANLEVSFNLLDEMWSQNIVNLFSTPLKLSEWLVAVMLLGIIKVCCVMVISLTIVWIFFGFTVTAIGWILLPSLILLLLSGWSIGLLTASLLIRWGRSMEMLTWVIPFLFIPFSTVYYPLKTLPLWAQYISSALPMTYVFETIRHVITTDTLPAHYLIISFCLSIFYLILAYTFFHYMFEKSREQGFARLEHE